MWQTSVILNPRPNLHQHCITIAASRRRVRIGYEIFWFFRSSLQPVLPPQRSVSVDIIRRMESLFRRRVPRAAHCHVMTCNDDDITITTGTRLHASMQILSIQHCNAHNTLHTSSYHRRQEQGQTCGLKRLWDPWSMLISCMDCCMCVLTAADWALHCSLRGNCCRLISVLIHLIKIFPRPSWDQQWPVVARVATPAPSNPPRGIDQSCPTAANPHYSGLAL